ncbi:hypothetical protein GJAV_G00128510 [Gymnothorax javanicus]|nr:hypothetical protein GJAV_G00128510 [Gymnothorax javanicus]
MGGALDGVTCLQGVDTESSIHIFNTCRSYICAHKQQNATRTCSGKLPKHFHSVKPTVMPSDPFPVGIVLRQYRHSASRLGLEATS